MRRMALFAVVALCTAAASGAEWQLPARAFDRLATPVREGQSFSLDPVDLPGFASAVLRLERFDVFSDDARIIAYDSNGPHTVALPRAHYFRGQIAGDDSSLVFLSTGDDVRGLII